MGIKNIKRMKKFLPQEGSVRCLNITDKQYARMQMLVGMHKKTEKESGKQMILL